VAAVRLRVREALLAGAAGFPTGRSDNHRTLSGKDTPGCEADAAGLSGIVTDFDGPQHGVLRRVSEIGLLRGPHASTPRSTWSSRWCAPALGRCR